MLDLNELRGDAVTAEFLHAQVLSSDHAATQPAGTRGGWAMRGAYILADLTAVGFALIGAAAAVHWFAGAPLMHFAPLEIKACALLTVGLMLVAMLQKTYSAIPPRPARQFRGWVCGALLVCVAEVSLLAVFGVGTVSSFIVLVLATAVSIVFAPFLRALCRSRFGAMRWWGTRLLVVGHGEFAERVYADMQREPQWGLRPCGYVDAAELFDGRLTRIAASPQQFIDRLAANWQVERGMIALSAPEADELARVFIRSAVRIRHWLILSPLDRLPSLWLEECEAARLPAIAVTNRLASPWAIRAKRAFDISILLCLAPVLSPVIAMTALLMRLTMEGPIFYGQERIGRHGRRFKVLKFRTMHVNAAEVLQEHLAAHPELAAEWEAKHKLRKDPRVTWVGRILRPLSLDELPQAWNVLVGDMSLVGPRPIVDDEIAKYADSYQDYLQVIPGITGLWQVSGRNDTTYEERVDLDSYYVRNWSLWLDVYILACTVKVVLLGEGAY